MTGKYTSLHTHTMYSLKDAISRPRAMMNHLKSIGQNTVGITDHGVMYAISEYLKIGKEIGVKLIPGCEFYVANKGIGDKTSRDTYHLTVLALDKEGYHNLCLLHALSFREGFYYDPRVDLDSLYKYRRGLVALSGCLGGALPKVLLSDGKAAAESRLRDLVEVFDKHFYIELQNHGIAEQEQIEPTLREFAKKFHLPIVATNDSHYVEEKDWVPHDAIICLGTGVTLQTPRASRHVVYEPKEFRLKSYEEMAERFDDKELTESFKIGEMADVLDLSTKTFHIPAFCKGSASFLRKSVIEGLRKRYPKTYASREVTDRAEFELAAIEKGGFIDYILIIADVYAFMRGASIPFGAGRGSAAGSIVCYALGITDVDPLRFNLLFERFINPDRISMPDIDCDISQERRQEVIEYVKEKYGADRVAQIITYQTLGGRAVIRDVARVLGKDRSLGDRIAKLIPQEGSVTVDRELRHYVDAAVKDVKELGKLYKENTDAKEIIDLSKSLEGLPKTESLHASGVVISDKPLADLVPMTAIQPKTGKKKERVYAVGYDMRQIEDIGLIKFDFLGLRNVDIVDECIKQMVADGVVPADFDKMQIPLDDPATFDLLSRGLTAGVFQLESNGMRKYLKDLRPTVVDDVIAMVALYRPGPMQFIPSYCARKNGEENVTYPHPSLKKILEPTYGLVVYQEQIMQVGEIIAGWSKGRADQLRKVIGKKIIDKIEEEKSEFVRDAVKQGHKKQWATDLFTDFIEPAARYAFNLSHAAAYGLLSYITAYLKANYTTYYFGALLASVQDKRDKVTTYIADARALGIAILPPDVHESGKFFTALPKKKAVRYGLSAIKNVGEQAVDIIIKKRQKGDFVDLFDFVERTKSQLINTRTISSLIMAGALDSLPGSRDEQLASVDKAADRTKKLAEDRQRVSDGRAAVKRKNPIPDTLLVRPETLLSEDEVLANEREMIGTYLSGHPYHKYAEEAERVASTDLQGLREMENEQSAVICAIVTAIKEHTTKKNKMKMLFVTVEDDKTAIEVTVFPRQTKEFGELFQLDKPVVIHGNVDIAEQEDVDLDSEDEHANFERNVDAKFLCTKVKTLGESAKITRKVNRRYDDYEDESAPSDKGALIVTLDEDNYAEQIEEAACTVRRKGSSRVIFLLPNDEQVSLPIGA